MLRMTAFRVGLTTVSNRNAVEKPPSNERYVLLHTFPSAGFRCDHHAPDIDEYSKSSDQFGAVMLQVAFIDAG